MPILKALPRPSAIGKARHEPTIHNTGENWELLPNGTIHRSDPPERDTPLTISAGSTAAAGEFAASGIGAELPAGRVGGAAAEPLADRREYAPNRGDSIARGGNDLILEVKRLGEQRIGVAGKPV